MFVMRGWMPVIGGRKKGRCHPSPFRRRAENVGREGLQAHDSASVQCFRVVGASDERNIRRPSSPQPWQARGGPAHEELSEPRRTFRSRRCPTGSTYFGSADSKRVTAPFPRTAPPLFKRTGAQALGRFLHPSRLQTSPAVGGRARCCPLPVSFQSLRQTTYSKGSPFAGSTNVELSTSPNAAKSRRIEAWS